MKLKFYGIAAAITTLLLVGCGDQQANSPVGDTVSIVDETTSVSVEQTQAPTLAPIEFTTEGKLQSPLTGEWVDEEIAKRVPMAIMINNIVDAVPQSGIDHAEVLYEAYVEGNITRLMMIMQNYDNLDKIGPVRSCREFYVYFAKEYSAYYIHFGFSPLAAELLGRSEVQALDGMKGWCSFYRSTDRVAPHNAYTTTEGILGSVEVKGWNTTLPENFEQPLKFVENPNDQVILENGQNCTVFKPGFKLNQPEFVYNEQDGLYYRYQYGEPHVDMESNEQLKFKNILVKFVAGTKFENGTPILELMGNGTAYYITNGKLSVIQWKKDSEYGPTKYYNHDGTEVVFNQGKTFVNIITMDDAEAVSYN